MYLKDLSRRRRRSMVGTGLGAVFARGKERVGTAARLRSLALAQSSLAQGFGNERVLGMFEAGSALMISTFCDAIGELEPGLGDEQESGLVSEHAASLRQIKA
jgi:hypothetical protein